MLPLTSSQALRFLNRAPQFIGRVRSFGTTANPVVKDLTIPSRDKQRFYDGINEYLHELKKTGDPSDPLYEPEKHMKPLTAIMRSAISPEILKDITLDNVSWMRIRNLPLSPVIPNGSLRERTAVKSRIEELAEAGIIGHLAGEGNVLVQRSPDEHHNAAIHPITPVGASWGSGSEKAQSLHIENAYHADPRKLPEYLSLYFMRTKKGTHTTVMPLKEIFNRASEPLLKSLERGDQYDFVSGASAAFKVGNTIPIYRKFDGDIEVANLYEPREDMKGRMVPTDKNSKASFKELDAIFKDIRKSKGVHRVASDPGDFLLLCNLGDINRIVMHGRGIDPGRPSLAKGPVLVQPLDPFHYELTSTLLKDANVDKFQPLEMMTQKNDTIIIKQGDRVLTKPIDISPKERQKSPSNQRIFEKSQKLRWAQRVFFTEKTIAQRLDKTYSPSRTQQQYRGR
jgi:hypothetical protein